MTRLAWTIALGCASVALTDPAASQVSYRQPAGGGMGGGLLELLMTGQSPGRAAYRSASAYRTAPAYPADPFLAERAAPLGGQGQGYGYVRREVDPAYRRQMVSYDGADAPGTIVVDTPSRYLYHVQGSGQAMRYGIGVGRPGFTWSGVKHVSMKREWPDWTPPAEMLARRPDLPRHMVGGPANPLGARALYLGSSLYRIHGTNEPWTIGQDVSSGCIRMMNEDVMHLYGRVGVGTRVRVI